MATQARQTLRALLVGLAVVSGASGAQGVPRIPLRPPTVVSRIISLPQNSTVPELYVEREVSVVLRFQKRCDPSRTRLLDAEGYFMPLMMPSPETIMLTAHQRISPLDRFRLLVYFDSDNTPQPFVVTGHDRTVDQQVNVISDPGSVQALEWRLADVSRRDWLTGLENERLRMESMSPIYALATLLAFGAEDQTPFLPGKALTFETEHAATSIRLCRGKGNAAAIIRITNKDKVSWKLLEARLSVEASGESRPFALRMDRPEILPAATGTLAVVVNKAAFFKGTRTVNLRLSLYRDDGREHAVIKMEQYLVQR